MPAKTYLVTLLWIRKRLAELIEEHAPANSHRRSESYIDARGYANVHAARSIVARRGFPLPYYSPTQREELQHRHHELWEKDRVEAFLQRVMVPVIREERD